MPGSPLYWAGVKSVSESQRDAQVLPTSAPASSTAKCRPRFLR